MVVGLVAVEGALEKEYLLVGDSAQEVVVLVEATLCH